MSSEAKDPLVLKELRDKVIARTGHAYYQGKDQLLFDRIRERMRAVGAATAADYASRLESGADEWRALESAVTINETYFFRHPEQFAELRTRILPRFLQKHAETKSLRIWSIGCSTGAEPYSVAIILRDLLGDRIDDWRLSIVGGDISDAALARAREGRFSEWALRTVSDSERERLFVREGASWRLKGVYRAMVRFERQNLLDVLGPFKPHAWSSVDLILCRNVLIYFDVEQAAAVAAALRDCLSDDGELLLGPIETATIGAPLPEAGAGVWAPAVDSMTPQVLADPVQPLWTPFLPDISNLPRAAANDASVQSPTMGDEGGEAVESPGESSADRIEKVRRLADAGAYEEAQQLCARLIAEQPLSARLQYYDGILRQVSEDRIGAEAALRRAVYLDRTFVLAHHRLGALMLSAGRVDEARRALTAAARLAEAAPLNAEVAEGQGLTAAEFARQAREQIARLSDVRRAGDAG